MTSMQSISFSAFGLEKKIEARYIWVQDEKCFFFPLLWKSGKVGVEPKPLGNALAVWSIICVH